MIHSTILDVTQIAPRLKHPTIFDYFDSLVAGESFIIKNDHDPKPLYYQLMGERGNLITWEYLENGPEQWLVKIGKPNEKHEAETIGKIAAKDSKKAALLKSLGIDFCCGGKQNVKEAAASIGMEEEELIQQLNQANSKEQSAVNQDFNNWKIDFLCDYIINTHHENIKQWSPELSELAQKVATVHGAENPELFELNKQLTILLKDLNQHLEKEEKQLFPLAKNMENLSVEEFDELLQILSTDHEEAGDELKELRKITGNYQLPENACYSYSSLFHKLKEFEADLFQHIHLENNILFPKLQKAIHN
mgnify:CR=1 FL=1